jgi:hypothetical protein
LLIYVIILGYNIIVNVRKIDEILGKKRSLLPCFLFKK